VRTSDDPVGGVVSGGGRSHHSAQNPGVDAARLPVDGCVTSNDHNRRSSSSVLPALALADVL